MLSGPESRTKKKTNVGRCRTLSGTQAGHPTNHTYKCKEREYNRQEQEYSVLCECDGDREYKRDVLLKVWNFQK